MLRGWLLDAYIRGSQAILWFRTEAGATVKLTDSYRPNIYVKLREGVLPEETIAILREHPHVLETGIEWKYRSVMERRKTKVLRIVLDGAQGFRGFLKDLERLSCVEEWFNADILHIQRYAFAKGIAPTQRLEVRFSPEGSLIEAKALKDDLEIRPPPFTSLIFHLETSSGRLSLSPSQDPEKDRISKITLLGEDLAVKETLEGSEDRVLEAFVEKVREGNPDLLVTPDCEGTIPYLLEGLRRNGLSLQLGREPVDPKKAWKPISQAFPGRIALSLNEYFHYGLAGIVERSRFSMLPLGLAAGWAAGRLIDSRQCYEAFRREILIPRLRNPPIYGTTAKDLAFKDRGGLILSPVLGLHENVAVLDFESMFPNIIVRYNISYETVTPEGIDLSRQGFLGELTKEFLERRLQFKHMRKEFPQGSQEWLWCEQRQSALKGILVCIYGFSGCDMNRYGNVYAYAKVNEVSRELLVKAIGVCRSLGYRVLYADCDSVFVQKDGASKEDYEKLAGCIEAEVGLPIALDRHFRFLVLLAQEKDPRIGATRRYFGKLTSGELFFRGIELRRRDYPPFIKEFEAELMGILLDAKSREDVIGRQYERAKERVIEALEVLASGYVSPEKLVMTKILRKPLDSYRSLFPHVSAAVLMTQRGKKLRLKEGRKLIDDKPIDFLYVNAEHTNPLRRVMVANMLNGDHRYYDREKYQQMLLDVAETVLGWNGFRKEEHLHKGGLRLRGHGSSKASSGSQGCRELGDP
ncbi:MAG: DNA polymerase domain-containing protein [Candidatus Bathyarchaeia archaeon]